MKKYLLFVLISLIIIGGYQYLYYYQNSIYVSYEGEITSFSKVEGEKLFIDKGKGYEVFDIRGVNLGLGKPGKFATEFSITKEEYLKWFKEIQALGANVVRTYILAHDDFYDAFYEYNLNNPDPLYLIHGVWVDDYMLHSYRNAFDKNFYKEFLKSCKATVDVIHGKRKSNDIQSLPTQSYNKDISQWVYGYILGVEWETDIVAFTDKTGPKRPEFKGEYLYTENASNFEIFLAMIGDETIKYETEKYGTQRTVAFSNWPTTCPIEFSQNTKQEFGKYAKIDVEHIKSTENFNSGQYASYHVYPYYPEYLAFENPEVENSYLDYLKLLSDHHSMPVIISEFGVPSSRGMASYESKGDKNRNQGFMSEREQGNALVSLYKDIKESGCAGGMVFVWQDEWFKRTWNTMGNVDLQNTAFWSDYQTNEQYFGLLSFDPGKDKSICYVDGDKSDWSKEDIVIEGDYTLSMKYDEKFIYFLAEKEGFDLSKDKLYIPLDTNFKSGARRADNLNLNMSHSSDFVIEIFGEENSRLWVQERYDTINAIFGNMIRRKFNSYENPPKKDSTAFNKVNLLIQSSNYFDNGKPIDFSEFDLNNSNHYSLLKTYETGKLTYGNANPSAEEFNSLADFFSGEGFVEIKIPWELLNFADPSQMKIHDDYYDNYGVEYMRIRGMNVGLGNGMDMIDMEEFPLVPLGTKPVYHERLKESYYILQEFWKNN